MYETNATLVDRHLSGSSHLNSEPWTDDNTERLLVEWYVENADLLTNQVLIEHQSLSNQDDSMIARILYERNLPQMAIRAESDLSYSVAPIMQWPLVSKQTMYALQEWEGYVIEKRELDFVARLVDLTALTFPRQAEMVQEDEAIIPLSEISVDDIKQMEEGSVFRWVIGYEKSASGTKRRVSEIVFRNLPKMTERQLSEGMLWARTISQSIGQ